MKTESINTLSSQGIYHVNQDTPENEPGVVIVFNPFSRNSSDASVQLFVPWNTEYYNSFIRMNYNGSWYKWSQLTNN